MSNITNLQQNANQSGQLQQANTNSIQSSSASSLLGVLSPTGYGGSSGSVTLGQAGYLPTTSSYGTLPQQQGGTAYGYNTWPTNIYTSPVDPNTFSVRKVENGYILSRAGKEYVVTDEKSVEKFLKLAGIVL